MGGVGAGGMKECGHQYNECKEFRIGCAMTEVSSAKPSEKNSNHQYKMTLRQWLLKYID